ncbi:hypothetical protein EVAR_10614_1 [Eumeta japonica]|uniref:Uncharacterized protein n=1 Tax=Eumeta variegata TaxID=151549 RepID=A0A4C1U239_EUMVA|nr:hypothetical protein EVAR_10614_1 [Eumeta japonica]
MTSGKPMVVYQSLFVVQYFSKPTVAMCSVLLNKKEEIIRLEALFWRATFGWFELISIDPQCPTAALFWYSSWNPPKQLDSFFSPPQAWMSDIWMRRRRLGSAQRSIPEAALARNIFAKTHLSALPTAELSSEMRV